MRSRRRTRFGVWAHTWISSEDSRKFPFDASLQDSVSLGRMVGFAAMYKLTPPRSAYLPASLQWKNVRVMQRNLTRFSSALQRTTPSGISACNSVELHPRSQQGRAGGMRWRRCSLETFLSHLRDWLSYNTKCSTGVQGKLEA